VLPGAVTSSTGSTGVVPIAGGPTAGQVSGSGGDTGFVLGPSGGSGRRQRMF
jgi:hypothetical protein